MRAWIFAGLGLALAGCNPAPSSTTPATPDAAAPGLTYDVTVPFTYFSGGTIYSGLDGETLPGVLVGPDGLIVSTAPREEALAIPKALTAKGIGYEVSEIDLGGATMFPGFVDGHAHLLGIGERELTLNLEGTASLTELVTQIEAMVFDTPEDQILFGRGWIESDWPEARMPTVADLDAAAPDHPVILVRADGHALVANSRALELAGITDETPDVEGGKIERDASGKATGILIDFAMTPVLDLVATPSAEDTIRAYVVGAQAYAARGWTGMHNMSVPSQDAAVLERLDLEGRMPIRLHNNFDEDAAGFQIASDRAHETDTITNRAVKLYMDGALGSRGALLIEPYSDRPDTSGLELTQPERLTELMDRAQRTDVQLAIHAIGDLANRRILDVFEAGGYGPEKRWRIEHTQILHPDDIARVGELGLIASMQPSHAIGDFKFAPDRLGAGRLRGAYAWQSLLQTGAVIVGGSDAPVEVGTPQIEFYAAVARKALDGFSTPDWQPAEALTRQQALTLFTSAPAYAAFMEDQLGTIEVGKFADFTVFDLDLMTVPEVDILKARTVMTVVQGEIVFSALDGE